MTIIPNHTGKPAASLRRLLPLLAGALLGLSACEKEATDRGETEDIPAGKTRIEVSLAGVANGISPWRGTTNANPPATVPSGTKSVSLASASSGAAAPVRTRAGEGEATLSTQLPWGDYTQHDLTDTSEGNEYNNTTNNRNFYPLPKGETLRLIACQVEGDGGGDAATAKVIDQRTYVVGDDAGSLYPCTVDKDGRLLTASASPLYLAEGNYYFYALSPARALTPSEEGSLCLPVDNGQYLLATDWRYTNTEPTELKEDDFTKNAENKMIRIRLNPIINQTARLKFSLYSDDETLHSLVPSDAGLTVSGLQVPFGKDGQTPDDGASLLNWSLGDTLRMAYGHKDAVDIAYDFERETIQVPAGSGGGTERKEALVITTAILPTDATSQPLVVMFRGKVNGVPTTYSMMLNEKVFRAGFSYNYVGKVSMRSGVAAIEWQVVTWETDLWIGDGN